MTRARPAVVVAIALLSALAVAGVAPERAPAGQGDACSARAALLSVHAIFRGLETGNGELALSGFMRRRSDLPAWGLNIEREPQLPGARESALNAVTPAQLRRLARARHARGESLAVIGVGLQFGQEWGWPQRDRVVPITIAYTRRADDFPNAAGFGDRGLAKGSFSCAAGRVMWLRGGHGAMTKPLPEHPRPACVKDVKVVQCIHVRGVGWASARDGCAGTPSPCS